MQSGQAPPLVMQRFPRLHPKEVGKPGLESGDHAIAHVRVEEGGVLGGDDDVGLTEHVERAAAGHAVDGGDDGLPEVVLLRVDEHTRIVEHEGRRHAT